MKRLIANKWKYKISFIAECYQVDKQFPMEIQHFNKRVNPADIINIIDTFIGQFTNHYEVINQQGTMLFNIYTDDNLSEDFDIGEYIGTLPESYADEHIEKVEAFIGDHISFSKL